MELGIPQVSGVVDAANAVAPKELPALEFHNLGAKRS